MPRTPAPKKAKAAPRKQFSDWDVQRVTAVLVLADGTVLEGQGFGAEGEAVGEVCFNTAMTGYQEVLSDPSYASQIVTFTFPHIGNAGANDEDIETTNLAASAAVKGCIVKAPVTAPANYRSQRHFDKWLQARGIIGLSGIDTRALTARIREQGMPNGVIAHNAKGHFDIKRLHAMAKAWSGLVGADLAKDVSLTQRMGWREKTWEWAKGYTEADNGSYQVVAVDFGLKRNILRCLTSAGCKVTVLPASSTAEDILAHDPDGIFLANGPGDPAATGEYSVPEIRKLIDSGKPIFGICLGHQMLGLALGGRTTKMHQGHHGANHPVKDMTTGKVEITSMNHGFAVERESLPDNVIETHVSLFDGSNAGLSVKDKPVFSVQYHPEASPGPQDSHYLFDRFVNTMRMAKTAT
jgi:carbamoyl-phosphate synthase small subunit